MFHSHPGHSHLDPPSLLGFRDFFEFSLEEYEACGFVLENKTYNLHENGNPEWNIVTEYESKWIERGLPIHRVEAVWKGEV